jgi:hypothetical protein
MVKNNDVKFTLPMLEAPRTLRLRFHKLGNLQYYRGKISRCQLFFYESALFC